MGAMDGGREPNSFTAQFSKSPVAAESSRTRSSKRLLRAITKRSSELIKLLLWLAVQSLSPTPHFNIIICVIVSHNSGWLVSACTALETRYLYNWGTGEFPSLHFASPLYTQLTERSRSRIRWSLIKNLNSRRLFLESPHYIPLITRIKQYIMGSWCRQTTTHNDQGEDATFNHAEKNLLLLPLLPIPNKTVVIKICRLCLGLCPVVGL